MRDIVSIEPIRIQSRDRTDQAFDNINRPGDILSKEGTIFRVRPKKRF